MVILQMPILIDIGNILTGILPVLQIGIVASIGLGLLLTEVYFLSEMDKCWSRSSVWGKQQEHLLFKNKKISNLYYNMFCCTLSIYPTFLYILNTSYPFSILFPDEPDPRPVFEKVPLDWEEDAELYSKFLDRKVNCSGIKGRVSCFPENKT